MKTKSKRILIGFASIAPLAYLLAFFLYIFPALAAEIRADREHVAPEHFQQLLWTVGVTHVAAMILGLIVLVYFSILLYRARNIESGQKTIWALALFFGNVIVFPVFFYMLIWKDGLNTDPS